MHQSQIYQVIYCSFFQHYKAWSELVSASTFFWPNTKHYVLQYHAVNAILLGSRNYSLIKAFLGKNIVIICNTADYGVVLVKIDMFWYYLTEVDKAFQRSLVQNIWNEMSITIMTEKLQFQLLLLLFHQNFLGNSIRNRLWCFMTQKR